MAIGNRGEAISGGIQTGNGKTLSLREAGYQDWLKLPKGVQQEIINSGQLRGKAATILPAARPRREAA